jgi:hypothetical protein
LFPSLSVPAFKPPKQQFFNCAIVEIIFPLVSRLAWLLGYLYVPSTVQSTASARPVQSADSLSAFIVGAMLAKSKSKNRALVEEIAPAPSAVTRAKDKKNNEDVALALAQSQLDQIELQEAKELDQKILDMTMRRSLSNAPATPHTYVPAGGKTYVSSAAYVAPHPEFDVFPPPLPMLLLPRKSSKLVVLGSTNSKTKLSLVVGKESLKSPLKWGEGLLSKSKRLEPPSCSPVNVLETSTELQDSKSESINSTKSSASQFV